MPGASKNSQCGQTKLKRCAIAAPTSVSASRARTGAGNEGWARCNDTSALTDAPTEVEHIIEPNETVQQRKRQPLRRDQRACRQPRDRACGDDAADQRADDAVVAPLLGQPVIRAHDDRDRQQDPVSVPESPKNCAMIAPAIIASASRSE